MTRKGKQRRNLFTAKKHKTILLKRVYVCQSYCKNKRCTILMAHHLEFSNAVCGRILGRQFEPSMLVAQTASTLIQIQPFR